MDVQDRALPLAGVTGAAGRKLIHAHGQRRKQMPPATTRQTPGSLLGGGSTRTLTKYGGFFESTSQGNLDGRPNGHPCGCHPLKSISTSISLSTETRDFMANRLTCNGTDDRALPDQNPQGGMINSSVRKLGFDDLPTEIIQQICSLILTTGASKLEQPAWHRFHRFPLDPRPCAQTLANLSAASSRYRDIVRPILYSSWRCHGNQTGKPLDFVRTLVENPALGLLLEEVIFQSGPSALGDTPSLTAQEDGIFRDTALRLLPSFIPLDPITDTYNFIHPWVNRQLLPLIFLLAPNLKRLSLCATSKDLVACNHPLPPLLSSVETMEILNLGSAWDSINGVATMPRVELFPILRPLIRMSPTLTRLTIRHTCLPARKAAYNFKLDCLLELHLRDVFVSGSTLQWILQACNILEVFSVHLFPYPEDWSQRAVGCRAPEILTALSHLRNSLRSLAINLWEYRNRGITRGEQAGDTALDDGSVAYPDGLGDLPSFTKLETLKLDPTTYCHPSSGKQAPVTPPPDHLLKRLPASLHHLVLPGAPGSLEPTLHELAARAAAGEFPRLETVAATFDEDRRVWEEPSKHWGWEGDGNEEPRPVHFLHPASADLFKTFLGQERKRALEEAFGSAGVVLKHIDSGQAGWSWTTDC